MLNANGSTEQTGTQHILLSQSTATAVSSEDMKYLEAKGCFSLPSHETRDHLVYCYFQYVHPLFPIIDVGDFMERYYDQEGPRAKLVLLWSMFSVATTVGPTTLSQQRS